MSCSKKHSRFIRGRRPNRPDWLRARRCVRTEAVHRVHAGRRALERSKGGPSPPSGRSRGLGRAGGWLADEVGMGKTMVVTRCVLAEPAKDLKTIKDTTFASGLPP